MNNSLKDFLSWLDDENDIWFLVPSGVIYGKLVEESDDPEIVILSDAYYYSGEEIMDLGPANIIIAQISGWGNSPRT